MPHIAIPDALIDDQVAVLGHYRPEQATAGLNFSSNVYQTTSLPLRLAEGARYRTAQINGCGTCQSWRAARDLPAVLEHRGADTSTSFIARGEPAPDEAFYADVEHWQKSEVFSEAERLGHFLGARAPERTPRGRKPSR